MQDRRHDQKGRSTGRFIRAAAKHAKIEGQFAPRLIEMLESPPFRVLSLTGHRILARLEIEMGHHGGSENGNLTCTYADLERFGINRRQISAGFAELVGLGFVAVERPGRAGNAEYRVPTLYRLTYLHTAGCKPTHDWRQIETIKEAEAIVRQSRAPLTEFERRRKAKRGADLNQKAGVGFAQVSGVETHTEMDAVSGWETHTTVPGVETHRTVYISTGGHGPSGQVTSSNGAPAVPARPSAHHGARPHDSETVPDEPAGVDSTAPARVTGGLP